MADDLGIKANVRTLEECRQAFQRLQHYLRQNIPDLAGDKTVTGLWTFDRDPAAPFAVSSGSAYVPYLDADKLDGQHGAYFMPKSGGTFTGAVTMQTTTPIYFRDAAIHAASLDDGHLDLTADISIDLNAATQITGTLTVVGGHIYLDEGQSLGTPGAYLYWDGGILATVGGDVRITNANLEFNTTYKVQFRDPQLYIHSSADSILSYVADGRHEFAGGPVYVGSGTPVAATGVGDIFVADALEVVGNVYLKGSLIFIGPPGKYGLLHPEADDGLHWTTYGGEEGYQNRNIIICDHAAYTDDYNHSSISAHPTWIIHSITRAASETDEWLSLSFPVTHAAYDLGSGWHQFNDGPVFVGTDSPVHMDSEGDLFVSDRMEVKGISYFDELMNVCNTPGAAMRFFGRYYGHIQGVPDDGLHIAVWGDSADLMNRNIIVCDYGSRVDDFDHSGISVDPHLFMHSTTRGTSETDEWWSISFPVTHALYEVGSGWHEFAGDILSPSSAKHYFDAGASQGTEYIHSAADGRLDIEAATSIDLNAATQITGTLTVVGGHIYLDEGQSLGTPGAYLYWDGGILATVGGDVRITNANLEFNTTYKVQFRDAAIYIASLDDGHLDLTADVSIDLNADILSPDAAKHYFEASGSTPGTEYITSGADTFLDLHSASADAGIRFYSGANLLLTVRRYNAAAPDRSRLDLYGAISYIYHAGTQVWKFATSSMTLGVPLYLTTNLSTFWGVTNRGQVVHDGTNLIINPNYQGSGWVYIGATHEDGLWAGELKVGDATNYAGISAAGDLMFYGTGGLAFGELWVLGNAVATTIAGAGTFAQFVGFSTDGQSNDAVPVHAQDHITITTAGKYLVVASFHVESIGAGAADVVSIEIRKNNGTGTFSNLHAHRKLDGGGGDIGSISISGIADLAATDTVEVWLTNDDNATDILVADANLSVVQIGGT